MLRNIATAQIGERTVMRLPSNWTTSATGAEITLTSSAPVEEASASSWWDASAQGNTVTFKLAGNTNRSSTFLIGTNSTEVTYNYELTLNDTKYSGRIITEAAKDSRFAKWTDPKEHAATAFVPEGWSADLQIIRPYKSMTGFVFFARGSENTLVYVFQPFMPLHLLPSDSMCEEQACPGMLSAEKVRDMSLGNAPIVLSDVKTPEQYFENEVLPLLRKNLNSYRVELEQPVYALAYRNNSTEMAPAHDVAYSFDVEGKRIEGRAMIFMRNYTAGGAGLWNGFTVGVESSERNFDVALQQAAVTLLTLRFDDAWLDGERKVLLENTNTSQELGAVPELMANSTLLDFDIIVPTAAHKMVRTYNDTMIAGFLISETGEELHLPLFPDSQHWYLDGDSLVGRKHARNPANSTSLERLF
ncbi:MAG TPA: hypothetical protein VD736_08535 [Nitrososphaera sp.]|nr:hypothetical protein [Nitrososphaera sp.]